MAVKRDTGAGNPSSPKKKIPVTYISDETSAALRRTAAIKRSPQYLKELENRKANTLLSQELIDRQQRRLKKSLTVTEAKIIKGIVAGKKRREAARAAGITGSDEVVSATTSRMLNKVNVKESLQLALAEAGVDVSGVAEVIAEGMKADKVVIVGSGDDAMADVMPDHSIRLRAGQMAAKYLGAEEKEEDPNPTGNTFNFINNANFSGTDYVK